jgi:hypothetical protein
VREEKSLFTPNETKKCLPQGVMLDDVIGNSGILSSTSHDRIRDAKLQREGSFKCSFTYFSECFSPFLHKRDLTPKALSQQDSRRATEEIHHL